MKKFITLLLIFLLLIGVFFSLLLEGYNFQLKKAMTKQSQIDFLILGDSHLQGGINTNLFPNNSLNWAQSAENYFYCKTKIKFLIDNQIKIDNLILAYGPHNVKKEIDSTWILDENNFLEKCRVYFPFIKIHELIQFNNFTNRAPFVYFELLPELLYQSIYSIERQLLIKKLPYTGGYEPLNSKLNVENKKLENKKLKSAEYSVIQLYYLNEIIDICNNNHINLILLNAPVYGGEHAINPSIKNNNFRLFDYGDLYGGKSEYFADYVHLNTYGSNEFTKKLLLDLNNSK